VGLWHDRFRRRAITPCRPSARSVSADQNRATSMTSTIALPGPPARVGRSQRRQSGRPGSGRSALRRTIGFVQSRQSTAIGPDESIHAPDGESRGIALATHRSRGEPSPARSLCHDCDRVLAVDPVPARGAKRSSRRGDCVDELRSGWLATADADLPSLSYGHLVGDSTGPCSARQEGRCGSSGVEACVRSWGATYPSGRRRLAVLFSLPPRLRRYR
jgi:hypothetical protein